MVRSDSSAHIRAAGARPLTRRRPTRTLLLLLLGCVCGLAGAADQAPQEPPKPPPPQSEAAPSAVVARVNGTPIRRVDLDEAIANFRRENTVPLELPPEELAKIRHVVLEGLIGSVLLYQMAQTIPIEVPRTDVDAAVASARKSMGDEEYKKDLERRGMTESEMTALVRQNLTVQKLIQDTVMSKVDVSEAEIKEFYDKNSDGMVRPEAVEASLIVVKSESTGPEEERAQARQRIQQALDRVKSGEAFPDVARSLSEDGTAAGGGALGWVPRGVMIPEIETVLFALEPGRVSGIVETPMGLNLLKVTAKRPAGRMSLEEARTGIAEILKQQKTADTLQRMVMELRSTAKIEIL